MPNHFIPTMVGQEVAQTIQREPEKTEYQLEQFASQLYDYYKRTGMTQYNPRRAYAYRIRNQLRAVAAPLLHGIEEELASDLRARRKNGQAIVSPDDLAATRFDRRLTNKGQHTYTGAKLNFLRVSSALSYAAAVRFIRNILIGENNYGPVFQAFRNLDYIMGDLTYPQSFPMRWEPRERLKDNVYSANATVLDVFVPAAEHLQAQVPGADISTTMPQRVHELSRIASAKDGLFRRHVGYQYEGAAPPAACPFAHESYGVWGIQALQNSLLVPGYCPENIPLYSRVMGCYATGAQLRLASATYIASETLWAENNSPA